MARRSRNRYVDFFKLWERLITAILANLTAFPYLEPLANKLQGILEDARGFADEQILHTAIKQVASKRLLEAAESGNKLATALQKVVVEHYGSRSDKLVEFGIQPFRGRRQVPVPQEPEEPPGPEVEIQPAPPAPDGTSVTTG
jgi:hypothetical protein